MLEYIKSNNIQYDEEQSELDRALWELPTFKSLFNPEHNQYGIDDCYQYFVSWGPKVDP